MRGIAFCLAALAAAGSGWAGSPQAPFRLGVCTHFTQGKGYLPGNIDLIREAGVASIRDDIGWRTVEKKKGVLSIPEDWDGFVDRAVKAGIEPLLILDYGNPAYDNGDKPLSPEAIEAFTRYAEFVVAHFKGKVNLYEVWNEWDIRIGNTSPGSAEDYARLLAKVYPRIKAVDPSITVMGGAFTAGGLQKGYLERLAKSGGLKNCDQISFHTYVYGRPGRESMPEAWAEWMPKLEAMLQQYSGGRMVPTNVTELGWPVQIGPKGIRAELAAAYLARVLLLARTMPFMKGIWWYDFQDDGWNYTNREHNFGLLRPDLTPKPGYFVLKDISRLVRWGKYLDRVDAGDPDIRVLKFSNGDGTQTWAVWSSHDEDSWQVVLSAQPGASPVEVRECGRGTVRRAWGSRDWAEKRTGAAADPNRLEITVREMPWLVTGKLDGVKVVDVKRREFSESKRQASVIRTGRAPVAASHPPFRARGR